MSSASSTAILFGLQCVKFCWLSVLLWLCNIVPNIQHFMNYYKIPYTRFLQIYIIITKNICYLLWNRGLWCSLNNTYPIFLTPCIRCTNHLCDSYDSTDLNPHFIPSLLRRIQNVGLLWRHRYKSRSLTIASNCEGTMTDCSRVVALDAFLAQWCWIHHSTAGDQEHFLL